MRSITIHNFEDDLEDSLVKFSHSEGISLNKSVKRLLRKALGLSEIRKEDFSDLCGAMDENEAKLVENALKDFEKIDQKDWK